MIAFFIYFDLDLILRPTKTKFMSNFESIPVLFNCNRIGVTIFIEWFTVILVPCYLLISLVLSL